MVACIRAVEVDGDATPPAQSRDTSLADILLPKGSPTSMDTDRNVVFVTDALEDFPSRRFQWILDHVIPSECNVTLLGVMPWLPFPYSCISILMDFAMGRWQRLDAVSNKTRFWTNDFVDLSALKGKSDWKNDHKYQKIRGIIELCEKKGVVPHVQLAMGHPLKLVVLEKTTNLHANLVVLDRHQRKNKAFFAERLPSSIVMMNNDGGVDMIKIRSAIIDQCELSPGESPANLPEELPELLNHNGGSSSSYPKDEQCRTRDSLLTRTRREMSQLFSGKAM